jgi:outer membrane protein assembly factor BamA
MYVGRFGRDAENGVLPPLYLGYSTLVRGYDANVFNDSDPTKGVTINDLIGSQMYVGNVEVRYPLTGPERLSGIKSRFLLTELNLFTDGGVAWGGYQGLAMDDKGSRLVRESKLVLSSGISLRVNVFGYLILEPFYAVPWQNGGFKNANFGLNFVPGW